MISYTNLWVVEYFLHGDRTATLVSAATSAKAWSHVVLHHATVDDIIVTLLSITQYKGPETLSQSSVHNLIAETT